jgi:hypothetical protein
MSGTTSVNIGATHLSRAEAFAAIRAAAVVRAVNHYAQ